MVLFSTGFLEESGDSLSLHCHVNDGPCVLEDNPGGLDVHVYPDCGDKLAGRVACYILVLWQGGLRDHSNSHQFVDGG